jgi:hypothetical protein
MFIASQPINLQSVHVTFIVSKRTIRYSPSTDIPQTPLDGLCVALKGTLAPSNDSTLGLYSDEEPSWSYVVARVSIVHFGWYEKRQHRS